MAAPTRSTAQESPEKSASGANIISISITYSPNINSLAIFDCGLSGLAYNHLLVLLFHKSNMSEKIFILSHSFSLHSCLCHTVSVPLLSKKHLAEVLTASSGENFQPFRLFASFKHSVSATSHYL